MGQVKRIVGERVEKPWRLVRFHGVIIVVYGQLRDPWITTAGISVSECRFLQKFQSSRCPEFQPLWYQSLETIYNKNADMEINVIVIEKKDGTRLFKTKGAFFLRKKSILKI